MQKEQKKIRSSTIILVWLLVIVMAIVGILLAPSKETTSETTPKESSVIPTPSRDEDWPEEPFQPVRYGTLPNDIPDMRPLAIDVSRASAGDTAEHQQLLRRFETLVIHHVIPDVGAELDRLLREHQIIYIFSSGADSAAAFFVRNGVPRLQLNAQSLAGLNGQARVAGYMLVLFHEFLHYRQWVRATDPYEKESFDETFPEKADERACPIVWKNEREAYYETCRVSNGLGISTSNPPDMDYCARVHSDKAFDQALYRALTRLSTQSLREHCSTPWLRMLRATQ